MGTYKLVALDLDGTLLDGEKQISASTRNWIRKLENTDVHIVLATGRGYPKVSRMQEYLKIKQPMVLANGAEVWKNPQHIWKRTLIPKADIDAIYKIAKKFDAPFWGYTTDRMVHSEEWTDAMINWNWVKFGIKHRDISVVETMRERIAQTASVMLTTSNEHHIECAPEGVSKATGLGEVCQLLGISMKETIAVGDNLNDMEMIREAGVGVAMGNALPELQMIADDTTETNDQDGVARVIQTYFFPD